MNDSSPSCQKIKVMITLAGGGFSWQSLALVNSLGTQGFEFHYVAPTGATRRERFASVPAGEIHVVTKVTGMDAQGLTQFLTIIRGAKALFQTFGLVQRVRPHAVIAIGTSLAIPLFLWSRLFGARTVFVESITRVSAPSITGRILSVLRLCDRFYVQWPEAVPLYRKAIYRGIV